MPKKKGKYGEGMNEKKMKVILWMNCWQPNPITSLESPSDSFLCVHYCMIGDEMQRLELVLVVYEGISLNT